MRRLPLTFLFLAAIAGGNAAPAKAWQEGSQTPAQIPTPPQTEPTPTPPQQPAPPLNPAPPPAPVHTGPVIVINPAHGATDEGARADNPLLVEKNLVLQFARMLRSEFERQGYRVVMTRNDDSNPSYEDRAAVANAYRDAIFISLHVSSTGQAGTARTYYYQFSSPAAMATDTANATSAAPPNAPRSGLAVWEEAQRPFLESSQRLAGALQAALAQRFAGSPATSTRFAVRELRSVAAPAIAVEVSSVSVGDPNILLATGASLVGIIERSVQAFRPVGSSSASLSGMAGAK